MNYWIFVAKKRKNDDMSAEEKIALRSKYNYWGFPPRTSNSKALKKGDKVVFYLCSPVMAFAADAELKSDLRHLSESEKQKLEYPYFSNSDAKWGVDLASFNRWEAYKNIKQLKEKLEFIKNKEKWGQYIRRSIRSIEKEDYKTIMDTSIRDN